jgi:hypothetical protein
MGATHARPRNDTSTTTDGSQVGVDRKGVAKSESAFVGTPGLDSTAATGSGGAPGATSDDVDWTGCGSCMGTAASRRHATQLRTLTRLKRRFRRSDSNNSGGAPHENP